MSNALIRVQVLRDFWRITRREEAYLRDRTSDSECKLTAPLASIIIVVFISGLKNPDSVIYYLGNQ